jgi:hypothetical protein
LVDHSLSIRRNGKNQKTVVGSDSEVAAVLREHFGIIP